MFFASPIGGLVGVEGAIVSKSRSLKLIGDCLAIMLLMLCVVSAMHSPCQNCYVFCEQFLVSQHHIQSLILCKCSLLSRIKQMFI